MALIAAGGHACVYCLVVHAANLAFWLRAERAPASAASAYPALAFATIFGLTSVALGLAEARSGATFQRAAERDLRESIVRITRGAGRPAGAGDLAGRHRSGPEKAPVRLVIFADYQRPACRRVEREVRDLVARGAGVFVSARHFPLCTDCNGATTHNTHPDACRSALAAETAGLLGGDEGFWRMHAWLFDRGGDVSDAELRAGARELGFDGRAFAEGMRSEAAHRHVREDVHQARAAGVAATPTILVNGVELRGWNVPGGIERAVRAASLSARHVQEPGTSGTTPR